MRIKQFLAGVCTIAAIGCHTAEHHCSHCESAGCNVAEPAATVRICQPAPSCVHPGPCVQKAPCIQGRPCVEKPPRVAPPPPKETGGQTEPVKHSPIRSPYGHARDFSWVMGNLRHVHVNGGSWKIRYCPLDKQDYWGGSVVLAEDARIDKFKDGDFVYAEGEIIVTRPTVYLAGPLYRITKIRKLTGKDREKAWAKRLQGTSIRK